MTTRYAIVQGNEDGNPLRWLDPGEIDDISQLMEDHGVERFMDDVPDNADSNYWTEGEALLLEVKILKVRPREIVTTWGIE